MPLLNAMTAGADHEHHRQRSRRALLWAVAGSAGLLALAGTIGGDAGLAQGGGAGPRASEMLSRAAGLMAAQRGILYQTGRPVSLETWDADFNASVAQANAEQVEMPGGGSKTPLSEMSEEMQKMYSEAEALMSEVDIELPFLNGTTEEPKQETQDWFSWVVRAHLP